MKILQVIHQDPRKGTGGAETYCRHLSAALRDRGHDLAVFCAVREGREEPLRIDIEKDIIYYSVDLDTLPSAGHRFQFNNSYANPYVAKIFAEILQDFQPSLVHVHHLLTLSHEIISITRVNDLPVALTLHDYWFFCHRINLVLPGGKSCEGPGGGWNCRSCGKKTYNQFPGIFLKPGQAIATVIRNRRLLRVLEQCDRIYAPSHHLLWRYESEGVPAKLLSHRPYGIPKTDTPPKDIPQDGVVFGYIGNIAPHKGIETMIRATQLLAGLPFKLKLFGNGDADYLHRLKQETAGQPVFFEGAFEPRELDKVHKQIDVLIVPSVWEENSPLVIHEASNAKVPVIASKTGGIPEIVGERRGGLLFPPGNFAMLAGIMREIALHPKRVMQLSRRAQTVRSIEAESAIMEKEYKELIEKKDEAKQETTCALGEEQQ